MAEGNSGAVLVARNPAMSSCRGIIEHGSVVLLLVVAGAGGSSPAPGETIDASETMKSLNVDELRERRQKPAATGKMGKLGGHHGVCLVRWLHAALGLGAGALGWRCSSPDWILKINGAPAPADVRPAGAACALSPLKAWARHVHLRARRDAPGAHIVAGLALMALLGQRPRVVGMPRRRTEALAPSPR